jgi:hypothetical protein
MTTNEWGIPNWLDDGAYGATRKWGMNRWRWEFTRRREDYRKDFDDNVQRTLAELSSRTPPRPPGRFLRPDEPAFVASTPDYKLSMQKYGLANLPNPRISDQPFYVLIFRGRFGGFVEGYGPDNPWGKETATVHAPEGTGVVIFDLSKPIVPQWENIRETVLWYQKEKYGKVVKGRKHPVNWPRYLRVLDGRAAGASWRKLQEVAIPETEKATPSPQGARQVWEQARSLMFNWPK